MSKDGTNSTANRLGRGVITVVAVTTNIARSPSNASAADSAADSALLPWRRGGGIRRIDAHTNGDTVTGELELRSTDGTQISVAKTGSGSPLVLSHGSTGSKESWALVAPLLAARHTVWSYDRRGRGASGDRDEYSFAREVDDLQVVLSAAGAGAHLVGHSFGSLCALEVARLNVDLKSLVLYEPPVHAEDQEEAIRDVLATIEAGELDAGLRGFLSAVAVPDEELDFMQSMPAVWERLLDGARRLPREIAAARSLGWKPDRYEAVDAPTLLLNGSLTDSAVYLTIDELRDAIPHAEVSQLAGQRHLAFAFDPQSFADAILRFTALND